MAVAIFPQKWNSKPPAACVIDRGHPLSQGIVLYVPFTERAGLIATDIAGYKKFTRGWYDLTQPSWDEFGAKFSNVGGGGAYFASDAYDFSVGNFLTIGAKFKSRTTYRCNIFGQNDLSNGFQFEINENSSYDVGIMIPGIFVATTNGSLYSSNQPVTAIYTRKGTGATHNWYVNGVSQALVYNDSTSYSDGSSIKYIGARTSSGQWFHDGSLEWLGIWRRPLTGDQVLWLTDEPYSLLQPKVNRSYFYIEPAVTKSLVGVSKIERYGSVKPAGRVEIDKGHPLAQGLELYTLLNGTHGNLANPAAAPTRSGDGYWNTSKDGIGWYIQPYPTSPVLQFPSCPAVGGQVITVMARGRGDHSSYGDVSIGQSWDGNSVWICNMSLTALYPYFGWYDGTWTNTALSPTVDVHFDGNAHTFGGTYDRQTLKYYLDGRLNNTKSYSGVWNSGFARNMNPISLTSSGRGDTVGWIYWVGIWNRALSEGEVAWLHAEPYAFLIKKRQVSYHFIPAGEAGLAVIQQAFRFRDDDGSESAATWLANQNNDITRGTNLNTRLRIGIETTGDAEAKDFLLEYKKSTDGAWKKVV